MNSSIQIAVIIVNYNASTYLLKALQALSEQQLQPQQVIIFDNASSEPLPEALDHFNLPIQIIHHPENIGFAAGNNRAIQYLNPEINWIALLNPDAYPDKAWLEEMVVVIKSFPHSAFLGSKLICEKEPHLLDGTGDLYHVSGKAWRQHYRKPLHLASDQIERLFSPCAAAALYRRDAFMQVQGFDEHFFCYYEDVDLAFRLWLHGYKGFYVPKAIALHTGSATTKRHSDFYTYHGHRNLVWTYFKNMPLPLLLIFLPLHALLNIATILLFIKRGQTQVILKSKWHALKELPRVWKQRKTIHQSRKQSTFELFKMLKKGLPW